MSVKKRKNSPFYQYDFTFGGRRFRRTLETTVKKEADELYAKLRSDLYAELKLGKKKDVSLNAAFHKYYIEHAEAQVWGKTVGGYLNNMLEFWGLDTSLSTITNAELSQLVNYLKRKPVKPATINRHLAIFSKLHKLAKNVWGVQVADIQIGAHKQKEPDSRIRYLTTAEAQVLISQAAPHLKPIIQFALFTGARLGNILHLEWKDVDMVSKRIIFKVKSTMPGGKNHIVDMASPCFEMLQTLKLKTHNLNSPYVFTYRGNKISSPKTAFSKACGLKKLKNGKYNPKLTQIHNFRFHDLRHTCASWLVQEGAPVEVVKEILGHQNIATTLKYAHHDSGRKKDALENVFKMRAGI